MKSRSSRRAISIVVHRCTATLLARVNEHLPREDGRSGILIEGSRTKGELIHAEQQFTMLSSMRMDVETTMMNVGMHLAGTMKQVITSSAA